MLTDAIRRLYYSQLGAPVHAVRRVASGRRLRALQSSGRLPDRLHVGAGPHRKEGWINADIVLRTEFYVDAARPLPLADGSMRFVYAEHFLEHLEPDDARRFLRECGRVLGPGGVLRLTTPDLKKLAEVYLGGADGEDGELREKTLARHVRHNRLDPAEADWCRWFNDKVRLGGSHRWAWDRPSLERALRGAGFSGIEEARHGESRHAELRGLESHFEEPWLDDVEQIIVEATKAS